MKKLNYLLLGAAGLLMASCSSEDVTAPVQNGDGNYTVTVKLPGDVATRSFGDGLTAENLHMAIYDASNGNALVTTADATFGNSLETTVTFNLAKGHAYNIAFFAQSVGSEMKVNVDGEMLPVYYFDAENKKIVANYEAMVWNRNNVDAYDCFYQLYFTGVIDETSTGETIILYRPVAQINWGTDDYNEAAIMDGNAFGKNGQYLQSTLTTKAYTEFSMLDNEVIPTSLTEVTAWADFRAPYDEVFPVEGYKYVAMQYVFATNGNEETGSADLYDLDLDIDNGLNTNAKTTTNDVVSVPNAPVQANYRTNIYGSLLTNPNEFVVIKEKNFWADYNINYAWNGTSVVIPEAVDGKYSIVGASELAGIAQLAKEGETFEGKTIELTEDIDLGGNNLQIGNATYNSQNELEGNIFQGNFNGNGHIIKNLGVKGSAGNPAGLFPVVGENGVVENVVIEGADVKGGASVGHNASTGAAVGILDGGKVSKVTVSGTVTGTNDVAGVVGSAINDGIIENCVNNATVNAAWQVGGVVGTCDATVSGCTNNGDVTATGNSVGGVVAEQRYHGAVTGCTNNGTVTAGNNSLATGGIVGWIRYIVDGDQVGSIAISGNTNTANVSGGSCVGGIVGRWSWAGTCTDNVNSAAAITAAGWGVAGIIGSTAPDTPNVAGLEKGIEVKGNTSETPDSKISGTNAWTICYDGSNYCTFESNTPANAAIN